LVNAAPTAMVDRLVSLGVSRHAARKALRTSRG
jgi:hypothetical protein